MRCFIICFVVLCYSTLMGPIVVSNVVLVCTVKWWLFSYQADECFRNAGFCQASSVTGHHAGHDGKVRDERRLHVNEQRLLAVADLSEDAHTVGGRDRSRFNFANNKSTLQHLSAFRAVPPYRVTCALQYSTRLCSVAAGIRGKKIRALISYQEPASALKRRME
jgi:hypothetical protein